MRVRVGVVRALVTLWVAGTVVNSLVVVAVTRDVPTLPFINVIGICLLLSVVNALASVLIYLVVQQFYLRKRHLPPKHDRFS